MADIPSMSASAVPMVDAATMAEVDRRAVEDFGITLLQRMEQAGSHLAALVRVELDGDLLGRRVVVAVGPGNNGGGGLAAARHLTNRGEVARLIGFVVRSGRPVVSLDLPSGMDPDTGATPGQAVSATATLTLALPKPGLIEGPGAARSGRLYLADIGLPAALYASMGIDVGPVFARGRIIELDRTP